jgi:galactokinase/mevalonate kinase-like predicted kinase
LNDIAFINDSNSKQVLNTFIDKYIKYIINKKIDDNIIEQYNEKFNKKKVLIDKKSPQ